MLIPFDIINTTLILLIFKILHLQKIAGFENSGAGKVNKVSMGSNIFMVYIVRTIYSFIHEKWLWQHTYNLNKMRKLNQSCNFASKAPHKIVGDS